MAFSQYDGGTPGGGRIAAPAPAYGARPGPMPAYSTPRFGGGTGAPRPSLDPFGGGGGLGGGGVGDPGYGGGVGNYGGNYTGDTGAILAKQLTDQTGQPYPAQINDEIRQWLLTQQGSLAGKFADQAQQAFSAYGPQGQQALDYYRGQMQGQNSVSAEQLRQGLQQMYGQQQSMAAGASPRNAAMAARTAAIQMGRASMGMAGQQALSGLQERNQAANQYGSLLQGLSSQQLQAALSSRQNAAGAYGSGAYGGNQPSVVTQVLPAVAAGLAYAASDRALKTDIAPGDAAAKAITDGLQATSAPSAPIVTGLDTFKNQIASAPVVPREQWGFAMTPGSSFAPADPATAAPTGLSPLQRFLLGVGQGFRPTQPSQLAYSDRALKTDIQSGDAKANAAIAGIRPVTYQYKKGVIGPDGRPLDLGQGDQFGITAQDLLAAGLPHTVVDVPGVGLAVDAGKLSTTNTGLIGALGKRLTKVEAKVGAGKKGAGDTEETINPAEIYPPLPSWAAATPPLPSWANRAPAPQYPAGSPPPVSVNGVPLPDWRYRAPGSGAVQPLPAPPTPGPVPGWRYGAPR